MAVMDEVPQTAPEHPSMSADAMIGVELEPPGSKVRRAGRTRARVGTLGRATPARRGTVLVVVFVVAAQRRPPPLRAGGSSPSSSFLSPPLLVRCLLSRGAVWERPRETAVRAGGRDARRLR